MPKRVTLLVRWPKPVRGIDRVWWEPYTVHTVPVRFARTANRKAFFPLDRWLSDMARVGKTQLKAECKRAGLSIKGDVVELRQRLYALVGEAYEPPEDAGDDPAEPASEAAPSTPQERAIPDTDDWEALKAFARDIGVDDEVNLRLRGDTLRAAIAEAMDDGQ